MVNDDDNEQPERDPAVFLPIIPREWAPNRPAIGWWFLNDPGVRARRRERGLWVPEVEDEP